MVEYKKKKKIPEKLGKFIRSKREERKISIRKLASLAKVSHPYLSQVEQGKFLPSPSWLKKIALPLKVNYFKLLALAGYIETDKLEEKAIDRKVLDVSDLKEEDVKYLTKLIERLRQK